MAKNKPKKVVTNQNQRALLFYAGRIYILKVKLQYKADLSLPLLSDIVPFLRGEQQALEVMNGTFR